MKRTKNLDFLFFCLLMICFIFIGCSRNNKKDGLKTSRITVKSGGIKIFSTTSDGPLEIELEGVDMTVSLSKDQLKTTEKK